MRHGSLQLRDSQATPNTLAIDIDEGNLTFDEASPGVVVKNRGALDHWSKGEEQPVSVSFTLKFTQFGSRSATSIAGAGAGGAVTGFSARDFLQNAGALLTTASGRTDVFTTNLWFTITNPVASGDQQEILKFTNFKVESLKFSEGAEFNTIAVSGRALLTTPVSARS
jgi:hypothetical protein